MAISKSSKKLLALSKKTEAEFKAYLDAKPDDCELDAVDGNSKSALLHAVHCGHIANVRALLDAGADLTLSNKNNGTTALHVAMIRGHFDIAKLLLGKNAPTHCRDNQVKKPLEHKKKFNAAQLTELRQLAAALNQQVPLRADDLPAVVKPGELDTPKPSLTTPSPALKVGCIIALSKSSKKLLALSKKAGAEFKEYLDAKPDDCELDAVDGNSKSALMYAVHHGHIVNVRALLDAGADTKLENNGTTALHMAMKRGYFDIAKLLLGKNAPVHCKDSKAKKPLEHKKKFNAAQLTELRTVS